MPTLNELAEYLEASARAGMPITYSDVLTRFPDLPPLNGIWKGHPMCELFGELDEEDNRDGNPLRTALVTKKVSGQPTIPGQGFCDTLDRRDGTSIGRDPLHQLEAWIRELNAVIAKYSK